jgi:hypothetical protein
MTKIKRGESYFEPYPRISEQILQKSAKKVPQNSAVYLKERGIMRYMVQNSPMAEAKDYVKTTFSKIYNPQV